ncbi:sigma-70 family RNA polymerase sigma factor [Streptomyces avermitilis]|uniref:RNA polymerase sigma factor n=1 Tax=Streptomyces avermitilis TaxID=33903 RepID=UPI00340CD6D7
MTAALRREGTHPVIHRCVGSYLDFFQLEYHRVVRFLMCCGADQQTAEDAAQEAFVEGWRMVTAGTWGSVGNQQGWIRRIALNAYRRPRGQKRRQLPVSHGVDLPDRPEPGPGHEELTVQSRTVLAALAQLSDDQRHVMALHLDGYSSAEAAQLLGLQDQKARDLLKGARRKLRRILSPAEPAERKG